MLLRDITWPYNTVVEGQRLNFWDIAIQGYWGRGSRPEGRRLSYSSVGNEGERMWDVDEGRGSRRAAYGLNLMVCYYREYIKHFETFQAQKSSCINRSDCSTKSVCRRAKNVFLQVRVPVRLAWNFIKFCSWPGEPWKWCVVYGRSWMLIEIFP